MTESDPKPAPSRKSARPTARIALAVGAGVLVAAGGGLYLARLAIARDVLSGWLKDRGVQADLEFDTFGLGGISGSAKVGDATTPALTVDRVEVNYRWGGFWSGERLGLQVSSVHLVRPILHATWTDKGLSFGPLDRIIEEFRRHPPPPDQRQPAITVEDGLLELASPYGPLEIRADAEVDDGRLINLDARSSAAQLTVDKAAFALGPAGLTVRTKGDRVESLFQAYVAEAQAKDLSAKGVNVRFAAQGPYPDLMRKRIDGPLKLRLVLTGEEMAGAGGQLGQTRVEGRFDGRVAGHAEDLALTGAGQVEAAAASGGGAGAAAKALRLTFQAREFAWNRRGGDHVSGSYKGVLRATQIIQAALHLRDAQVQMQGSGDIGGPGGALQLHASATARGGWTGLGPRRSTDDASTAALKTALANFTLGAPNVALNLDGRKLAVSLPAPVTIRTQNNGLAALSAIGGAPIYDGGAGRFVLTTSGGGLPQARLAVDRFSTANGAVRAQTRLEVKGDLGPARDASLTTAGVVSAAGGGFSYAATGCGAFSAARLDLEQNDLEKLAGKFCPGGGPLIASQGADLRLRGVVNGGAGVSPFFQMQAQDATAHVDVRLRGARAYGDVKLDKALVEDTSPQRRFYPVTVSGPIRLAGDRVRADLAATDKAGRALAHGTLTHDLASGAGGMQFDTGQLAFAEGGLQPDAISPLAAPIASPATGDANFHGSLAWTPKGVTSQGELKVARMDFKSPAGPVRGLSGDFVFDSLLPLTAPAGQQVKVEEIDILGKVTNAQATFGLDAGAVRLAGASAEVGGGQVALGPVDVPFDPKASWSGAVDLSAVQVKDLVKASPFGDKVSLDAKLTGRLPFTMTPQGVRIAGGELHAVEPGTLSIQKAALTGVQAQTQVGVSAPGVPVAKPAAAPSENLVADFAYQALEHLSFDTLSAKVDSLPKGRLGVTFRIKGAFDPPQHQELRLGYLEALRGTYMDKTLPLPSGTKVDLTLDTSVNLDQLLADYAEYQRLRGSGPVQP